MVYTVCPGWLGRRACSLLPVSVPGTRRRPAGVTRHRMPGHSSPASHYYEEGGTAWVLWKNGVTRRSASTSIASDSRLPVGSASAN